MNEKVVRLFENVLNCVVNVFMIINVKFVGFFLYCIMLINGVWYVIIFRFMIKVLRVCVRGFYIKFFY